jgi:hypothetical protein
VRARHTCQDYDLGARIIIIVNIIIFITISTIIIITIIIPLLANYKQNVYVMAHVSYDMRPHSCHTFEMFAHADANLVMEAAFVYNLALKKKLKALRQKSIGEGN